jgi:hypothetical protein
MLIRNYSSQETKSIKSHSRQNNIHPFTKARSLGKRGGRVLGSYILAEAQTELKTLAWDCPFKLLCTGGGY